MRRIGLALLFLLAPTTTFAQQEAAKAVVDDASLTSNFAQLGQVTLVSTTTDTAVKAEVGLEFDAQKSTIRTSIGVQAPIKKGADEQELFSTLTGLGNGAVATFRVTRIGFGSAFNDEAVEDVCRDFNKTIPEFPPIPTAACSVDELRRRIIDWTGPAKLKTALTDQVDGAIFAAAQEVCTAYNKAGAGPRIEDVRTTCEDRDSARAVLAYATQSPKDCHDAPAACWYAALDAKIDDHVKDLCTTLNSDVTSWGRISITDGETNCNTQRLTQAGLEWRRKAQEAIQLAPSYASLSASVSSDTFTYNAGSILKDEDFIKETKQGLAFTGTYGRLLLPADVYLGVNGTIKQAYEGAKTKQICEVVAGTAQSVCQTVATKAPSRTDHEVAQLELRRLLGTRVALNPRLGYDFKDKIWGAELVTYLFTQEKKGLNGGIHASYTQKKKTDTAKDANDFVVAVFIGMPFQLFGNQ